MTTEERLAKLERSCARWRIAAVVSLLVIGGLIAFAVAGIVDSVFVFNRLRVRSLEVVNEKGQTTAWLDDFFAGPQLRLQHPDGQGGGIRLWAAGSTSFILVTGPRGDKTNSDDQRAVQISTSGLGGGHVTVYNPFGKQVVSIESNKMNTGMVYVSDVNGKFSRGLSAD